MSMPVWPFKRRSIRHRTFGRMRPARGGRFWQARVPFQPAGREVEIHITAAQPSGAGPTEAQEHLYRQLAHHYPSILRVALVALHREYKRVMVAQPQLHWPAAAGPHDLLHLAPLDRIWIDDTHGHRFVLSFQHRKDKEHEFHVFFRNWKLESVASER